MRYVAGSVPPGWLACFPAAQRAGVSRYALAMCALRGEVRTMPYGPTILFNEEDVEQLRAHAA